MSPYRCRGDPLKHKEAGGGEVTALTVGGTGAVKDAKAIGVDHIVRVDAEADGFNALQSFWQKPSTLVLKWCTAAIAPTDAGSTGPGLAERLGWASVSNIVGARLTEGSASLHKRWRKRKLSVPLWPSFPAIK